MKKRYKKVKAILSNEMKIDKNSVDTQDNKIDNKCSVENNTLETKIQLSVIEFNNEREQNFINLLVKIVVSCTLKEYYEKGN